MGFGNPNEGPLPSSEEKPSLYPNIGDQQRSQPPPYSADSGKHAADSGKASSADDHVNPFWNPEHHKHSGNWGAQVMGAPAEPSSHPDNIEAATEGATARDGDAAGVFSQAGDQRQGSANASHKENAQFSRGRSGASATSQRVRPENNSPYVVTTDSPSNTKGAVDKFMAELNEFYSKAEMVVNNIWGHLTTGPSVADSAWGRMNVARRVVTEGGFAKVFTATFPTEPNEQLKKTYACFLSTSTGPVAGTLYISTLKFAFCSDRTLSYAPAPGQEAWSFYKVMVPFNRVKDVVPSVSDKKPAEKYIQLTTVDNSDFWFMGLVNYDKGVRNMQEAVRNTGVPAQGRPSAGSMRNGEGYKQNDGFSQAGYFPSQQSEQHPPSQQSEYRQSQQSGYSPQQSGYPPSQTSGYSLQQSGQPPSPQSGYASQQSGYPPSQQSGYPPQQSGYAPTQQSGYPSQQSGYSPSQQSGYKPNQG